MTKTELHVYEAARARGFGAAEAACFLSIEEVNEAACERARSHAQYVSEFRGN